VRVPGSIWADWQFWQTVVAAAAALLGFLGGTLIKYALDRSLDRRRQRDTACRLATALHAEVAAIRLKARQLLGLLGQSSGTPASTYQIGRAIGIPKATVFEQNADQLGLLPLELCRDVVQFYGIRSAAEGMLDVADADHRDVLLGWLLQVANTAPQPLMALDEFLGRPAQDYGKATAEPVADLPVRNLTPRPAPVSSDDTR
jgi:hypothetical protein